MMTIGREGGQRIPINDKSVSRKHLEVTPLQNGSFRIKNLGRNGTFVDGMAIEECIVEADTPLRLGPTYTATLKQLLCLSPEKTATDISHLEQIYRRHSESKTKLRQEQMRTTYYKYVASGIMLLCAMFGYFTREYAELKLLSTILITVFIPVGAILLIYSVYIQKKITKELPEKDAKLMDEFKTTYVCPECKKWLGDQPFEAVKQQGKCPYCQTKWK